MTGTADMADNVSVTNISSTNTDFTLVMSDGSNTSTGRALGMDGGLTYNPNTNVLTAETVNGNLTGNVTGNTSGNAGSADQVKTTRTNTSATHYLTFVDGDNTSATNETLNTSLLASFNPSNGDMVVSRITASQAFFLGATEVTSTVTPN